ncbi:hypothetical protein SADUNF_Sadunf06G0094900 [Salix dunnii]|uniref:Uncharacterized protein n=1 Tax=Salix dunnii TaxID=1413687 RepID=A0A835K3V4_9ROSI|nr:hypothetical protein SADUNF_Sadunf06G0094900 [Salix dunnii]
MFLVKGRRFIEEVKKAQEIFTVVVGDHTRVQPINIPLPVQSLPAEFQDITPSALPEGLPPMLGWDTKCGRLLAFFEMVGSSRDHEEHGGGHGTSHEYSGEIYEGEDKVVEVKEKKDKRFPRCTIGDMFFAGSETTSTTIEWAMIELLCDPMAMGRATE